MKNVFFFGLIISTLVIKELWKLFPYSEVTFKMFPYSEQMITKQTYFWFFCFYAIQLIVVSSWYYKFESYRKIFGVWFIFQALEVIEYYFTYNEPHIWICFGDHKEEHQIGINIIKFKYVAVIGLTIRLFAIKIKEQWNQ